MIYVINFTLFTALFWLLYQLWLKKETFFKANRLFLLTVPLLGLILPLLNFPSLQVAGATNVAVQLPDIIISGSSEQNGGQAEMNTLGLSRMLLWIYMTGVVISSGAFAVKLYRIYRLKKTGLTKHMKDFRLVRIPGNDAVFSFLNCIYIGADFQMNNQESILFHEREHIRQKHSWDLIYYEILRVFTWFNPFVYLLQNELTEVHEFTVDREVTRLHSKKTYVESLLNANFKSRQLAFTHPFIKKNTLKTRIMMLYKKSSDQTATFKFLILLPLIFVMLTYVSCVDRQDNKNQPEASEAITPAETDKSEDIDKEKTTLNKSDDTEEVLFRVVDKSPEFLDAPEFEDEEARKEALSMNVSKFVNEHYDVDEMKKYAEVGVNRIAVEFTIGLNGKVQDIKARSKVTELEEEATRVVKELPEMKPGEQDGKPVAVKFALPIVFQNK